MKMSITGLIGIIANGYIGGKNVINMYLLNNEIINYMLGSVVC
jgi:hypothetical protein